MDDYFERLKKIRKYRELTQNDMGEILGITGASYGRKERGLEGGLGLVEIGLILVRTSMNPLYVFKLLDSIEEADLNIYPIKNSIHDELKDLRDAIIKKIPDKNIQKDTLSDSLNKKRIRDILNDIKNWDDSKLDMIWAFVQGLKADHVSTKINRAVG